MYRLAVLCVICGAVLAQDAKEAKGVKDDLQARVFRARDRALPALVNVQPVMDVFQGGRRRRSTATGSGVIVREDGLVVTNFHVAGHAKKIFCTLADKTRVPAKLLGGDPATDLAILKLDVDEVAKRGGTFGVAKLGATTRVQVGEFVLALGSPRGLSMSLTKGVVSNIERYFGGDITLPTGELTGMYNNWIQTDAAINPGNSGGPLVNLDGVVIGINSRGIPTGTGLGFAIPADVVKNVYEQIVKSGRVTRAWIGLDRGLEPLSFDAPVDGVRIGHIAKDSPAARAGLRPGDIIVGIGDQPIAARFNDDIPPIRRRITESPLGEPLIIRVRRVREELAIEVIPVMLRVGRADQFAARRFGMTARRISDVFARRRGLPDSRGVFVTSIAPGGPAAAAGVRRGDIILRVGKTNIDGLEEFEQAYGSMKQSGTVLLSIRRGATKTLRALKPSKPGKDEDEDE